MSGEAPEGYPPPTLIRKRSSIARLRYVIALVTVALVLGTCTLNNLIGRVSPRPAADDLAAIKPAPLAAGPTADIQPVAPATAPVAIEAPAQAVGPVQPSADARQPNRWYYVDALGDGPGAIYSRDGGQWNFAFACNARAGTVEFIAVGTGSPGDFDQQSISVGKTRLMMDANYSKDGGGTISTKLPASHPFFRALDGTNPMEVRLLATRKTILPVGPGVVRLIRACRGRA